MAEPDYRPYTAENEGPPDFLVKLGLAPPVTLEDVEMAYREKVGSVHPDRGGDASQFKDLQTAYERAKQYAAFRSSRRGWLARQVEPYMRQQELVEELERRGAEVKVEQISWLSRSFGEGFATLAEKLVGIRMCGPKFGDDDVRYLSEHEEELKYLLSLDLANSRLTGTSLPMLAKLCSLTSLDLSHTNTGGEISDLVQQLPELQELRVAGTGFGTWHRLRLRVQRPELKVTADG